MTFLQRNLTGPIRSIFTIFRKEVATFFNSLIAYIVMGVFLLGNGLFFWVFGQNVLVTKEAAMDSLFANTPWFYLLLVPAITMRSFAEELRSGTIEFLSTKPITDWQIVLGKYLATVFLTTFCLLPTLVYFVTLQRLGAPPGNLDTGPIWGAYMGLVGLGAIFCALGVLASSITSNQVVAFILSLAFCFVLMFSFSYLADLPFLRNVNYGVSRIGINAHYESISMGVADTRDILYFVSVIVMALVTTKAVLSWRRA
jgi:ABC-2 type transport system permease protein